MKVRVEFTVDIDPEAWEMNYGVPRSEQREDIRNYCEQGMRDQLREVGVLKD